MTFEAFFATIQAPPLRAVALHWRAARGSRWMPGWSDIDPLQIRSSLRYVWAWRYDSATGAFTGRLSGEEIERAFGKSLRGAAMQEFFSPEAFNLIYPRHRRVVTEPAFMHGSGMVFIHVDRTLVGERIILPLAADGEHGDGIIGATFYAPVPGSEGKGADFGPEQVAFFPVDALKEMTAITSSAG